MAAISIPPPTPLRPVLRLVTGGEHDAPTPDVWSTTTVHSLRRAIAWASLIGVAILLWTLAFRELPSGRSINGDVPSEVIVKSGDSLWSIARTLDLDEDIRVTVDQLSRANGGTQLSVGQRVVIPAELCGG